MRRLELSWEESRLIEELADMQEDSMIGIFRKALNQYAKNSLTDEEISAIMRMPKWRRDELGA